MSIGADFWEDYEVLRIETPENLELRLPLAGFGPRFLALLVGSLIQVAAGVVVFIVTTVLLVAAAAGPSADALESVTMLVIVAMIVIFGLISVGYPLLFEALWNGQTPGKRLTGIRVVKRGGLPLAFADVLIRNLMRLVDYFPSYGLIGLISFFVSRSQQRLGDLAADTVVVREFTTRQPYAWAGGLKAGPVLTAAGTLDPRLSYVIASYLARRHQLQLEARLSLSREIIQKLGHRAEQLSLDEREAYLLSVLQSYSGAPQ